MQKKNEAQQLRDHLFAQMDRLSDLNCDLDKELKRADALAKVGTVIVNSHKQEVDMLKLTGRKSAGNGKMIPLKPGKQNQIGNG